MAPSSLTRLLLLNSRHRLTPSSTHLHLLPTLPRRYYSPNSTPTTLQATPINSPHQPTSAAPPPPPPIFPTSKCSDFSLSKPKQQPSLIRQEPSITAPDPSITPSQEQEQPTSAVLSTFDIFSIGIGPSSSHTVGPMRAARIFIQDLKRHNLLKTISQLRVDLYGSLALTGHGHGTEKAVLMGLEGDLPEDIDPTTIETRLQQIETTQSIPLDHGSHSVWFIPDRHVVFHMDTTLPNHSNGMRISAFDEEGELVARNEYYSVGGGFVVHEDLVVAESYKERSLAALSLENGNKERLDSHDVPLSLNEDTDTTTTNNTAASSKIALDFYNAESLLKLCESNSMTISQVVLQNELRLRDYKDIKREVLNIWKVMDDSITNGLNSKQVLLPGKLKVKRRAPGIYKKLLSEVAKSSASSSPKRAILSELDWISAYAFAVNEENAAGMRVVTAPTNGSSGVIPAVLKYYLEFILLGGDGTGKNYIRQVSQEVVDDKIMDFMFTAGAVGSLFIRNASISATQMGCMGEIGVASSMAAGALAAVMDGNVLQVENAAEISMEHHLGLPCDPPYGLVQIPCIERAGMGAIKAVAAAQVALRGDGDHRVTLDQAIQTMKETGHDMMEKYKETSLGGLAVNVPLC